MRPPCSRALLGLALLVGSSACGACGGWKGHGNTFYQKWERAPIKHSATYRFGMPGDGWSPLDQKGTQVAWWNAELDAVIMHDSQCESHGDSALEKFADHLRIDFRDWEVKSQEHLQVPGATGCTRSCWRRSTAGCRRSSSCT